MAATKADARPTKRQPEPAAMDQHSLEKRRRRLAASLEDVSDSGREAVEFELRQVEAEIDARRRRTERIEAARLGREEFEREKKLEAKQEEQQRARDQLVRLAGERATAAQNIDGAIATLGAAITELRTVMLAQAVEGRVVGLDAQMIMNERVLGVKLAHDLSELLPNSGSFRRWDHESRGSTFAELDAPFARLDSLLPKEES